MREEQTRGKQAAFRASTKTSPWDSFRVSFCFPKAKYHCAFQHLGSLWLYWQVCTMTVCWWMEHLRSACRFSKSCAVISRIELEPTGSSRHPSSSLVKYFFKCHRGCSAKRFVWSSKRSVKLHPGSRGFGLGYADDIPLLGENTHLAVWRSRYVGTECFALSKCKVLLRDWQGSIPRLNNYDGQVECANRFTYPGNLITTDGY